MHFTDEKMTIFVDELILIIKSCVAPQRKEHARMILFELVQYAQVKGNAFLACGEQRRATAFVAPKQTPTYLGTPIASALYAPVHP